MQNVQALLFRHRWNSIYGRQKEWFLSNIHNLISGTYENAVTGQKGIKAANQLTFIWGNYPGLPTVITGVLIMGKREAGEPVSE